MTKYLMRYYDHALKINESDTEASISKAEQERVGKMLSVAVTAQTIPRRLGADATPDELAADKLRARRVAHVAGQLVKAWGGAELNGGGADSKREAATVDWSRWMDEHRAWALARQTYIATWCVKQGGDERWAKSAITKLTNEVNWLEHALRN